jgi:hypothetical protein
MKRFMYFSVGVLCLAIAVLIGFHMGARTAEAQSGSQMWQAFMFASGDNALHYVMLPDGTIYRQNDGESRQNLPPTLMGNFWGGGPIPTAPSTLGGVKAKYR